MNHSNGLILLWSLAMRKAPEFTFNCQTEIFSVPDFSSCLFFFDFNSIFFVGLCRAVFDQVHKVPLFDTETILLELVV